MQGLKQRIVVTVFLFAAFFISTCVSVHGEPKQPLTHGDAGDEIWTLVLTGDTETNCRMVLRQSKTLKDTYFVSGKFSGRIEDQTWGAGELICKLKGRTTKSVFLVKITGSAYMMDGDAQGSHHGASGQLRGVLSRSQGFGTWRLQIRNPYGTYKPSGEWTAEKIK